MGRGKGKNKKVSAKNAFERNQFIRGKSKSLRLSIEPSKKLGYSPAQETASGAGTHGGSKKIKNKRDRSKAKKDLRNSF